MDEEKRLKVAVISGAAHALNYKRDNPGAADEDAIQHVTREMENILKKLEEED